MQDHSQSEATTALANDPKVNQQRFSPENPTFAAVRRQPENGASADYIEVNQHDSNYIVEPQPGRENEKTLPRDEQGGYGKVRFPSDEALHAPSIPKFSKVTDNTSSNIESQPHTGVNTSNQPQRDDSFYWHSPHSSASMSHDRDQNQDVPGTSSLLDATPEPQEQHISPPPIAQDSTKASDYTTNLYQSALGPYSASALGFGGPSDWEHFGDYDGEEVDDTDLYIRPKSPVKRPFPTDTSELPADPPPFAVSPEQLPTTFGDARGGFSDAHQNSIESITSGEVDTKQHQGQLDHNLDLDADPNNPTKLGRFDQPATQTSDKAEEDSAAKQQSRNGRSETTYLPQFPFEQPQRGPQVLGLGYEKTSGDSHNVTEDSLIGARISSSTKQDKEELPNAVLDVQSSDWAAITDDKSMEDQKAALSNSQQEDTEQLSKDSTRAQQEDEHQPSPDKTAMVPDALDLSRENSIKRRSIGSNGSVLSKIKEMEHPYADLDPWGKASLNRYVAMLREEARASTEGEKLNMFKAFVKKEWKLRAVLYGADDEQENDPLSTGRDIPIRRTRTLSIRRPASKALPALPLDAKENEANVTQSAALMSPNLKKSPLARSKGLVEEKIEPPYAGEGPGSMLDASSGQLQKVVEEDASEVYSPGGRPVQTQARGPQKAIPPLGQSTDDGLNGDSIREFPKRQTPDEKPIYTPFRYSQGYIDDSDQPVDRRASFRPYAALKIEPMEVRTEHDTRTVTANHDQHSSTSTATDRQVDTSDFFDQSQTSPRHHSSDAEPQAQASTTMEQDLPLDLRRFERADFDPLIAVLPPSGQIPNGALELSGLQLGMNAVPDEFTFIHQHVVAWDTKVKQIRSDHERERQVRQGESEQRIDALFNDDEIGYGDISELESEFKRAEAARKTEEDRAEYQTFVEEVFDAVWTRLHFEIDQLGPLYEQYSGLAHETLAGKDMFEAANGQYALAPTMSALLALHQKLEIRHQKAFEAVLERDRRLKKTEVAAWYTLGNVNKVKQLEKQFERAEKKAIADYCKQRNVRANRLMDVLDQNTLRGVGANQDYMEAVMKAVRRIASGRAFASAPASEPGLGLDEVNKAKTVTAVLASSSEQIVQTFHVADMLLNAADYELSVATAKLANADPPTFERLKDERAKEDTKLMRDLQHRLALIREDSRRTNDEIVKLLCFLGVQGGHAQANNMPKSSSNADPEHEQRVRKALEDAKKRNAQRAAEAGMP